MEYIGSLELNRRCCQLQVCCHGWQINFAVIFGAKESIILGIYFL